MQRRVTSVVRRATCKGIAQRDLVGNVITAAKGVIWPVTVWRRGRTRASVIPVEVLDTLPGTATNSLEIMMMLLSATSVLCVCYLCYSVCACASINPVCVLRDLHHQPTLNRCGQRGHIARNCSVKTPGGRDSGIKCYRCGKLGHRAIDCTATAQAGDASEAKVDEADK